LTRVRPMLPKVTAAMVSLSGQHHPELPPAMRNWITIRQAKEAGLLLRTWTTAECHGCPLCRFVAGEGCEVDFVV